MQRRGFILLIAGTPFLVRGNGPEKVRGKLTPGAPAALTGAGRRIELGGDDPTAAVLKDSRLADKDFEAVGRYTAPDKFVVDPIHTRNLFVYQNGKRLMVTYWCDVCYIRTYSPGLCWCCQAETEVDLIGPDHVDKKP